MNVLVSMKTRTVFGKVFSDCNTSSYIEYPEKFSVIVIFILYSL